MPVICQAQVQLHRLLYMKHIYCGIYFGAPIVAIFLSPPVKTVYCTMKGVLSWKEYVRRRDAQQ